MKYFFFLFSVFLTVIVSTDIEDLLDPVSQVDLLAPSRLLGRDFLFFFFSWKTAKIMATFHHSFLACSNSNMVLNSKTSFIETDNSELLLDPLESRDDLKIIENAISTQAKGWKIPWSKGSKNPSSYILWIMNLLQCQIRMNISFGSRYCWPLSPFHFSLLF